MKKTKQKKTAIHSLCKESSDEFPKERSISDGDVSRYDCGVTKLFSDPFAPHCSVCCLVFSYQKT